MVGCEHHTEAFFRNALEDVDSGGVAEPRLGERAVGGIGMCEFSNHLRLGASVGEHIHEVDNEHIEVVAFETREILEKFLAGSAVVEFVVGKAVFFAVALNDSVDERLLVDVFPLFLVFINPEVGELATDIDRHQSGEDGVARILCRGGEDAAIEVVLIDCEIFREDGLHHTPLVEAEIVDNHKEHLLAVVEERKHLLFHNLMAEHRVLVALHPRLVVTADELGKLVVCLRLLHSQQVVHIGFGGSEFELPEYDFAIKFIPIVDRGGVVDEHTYLAELLAVVHRRFL